MTEGANRAERRRPTTAREWIVGVAALVIVAAIIAPGGLYLRDRALALQHGIQERAAQIDVIIDHAAEEAREAEEGDAR